MDTPELVMTATIVLVGVLLFLLLLNAQFVKQAPDNTSQRLARIERKLDKIMAHLNIEIEHESRADSNVEDLVRAGKIIEAIKVYREAHSGVGLREAKQVVDDLKQRINAQ